MQIKVLIFAIPSHKKKKDREKLGTKAVQEEFHADTINGVFTWKVHYGWNSMNVNVWLPSLRELVGLTGTEHPDVGTYIPAMQGIPNAANDYNVDKNGGEQWAWLVEFNPSGGAAEIWRLCGNTSAWVRSPDKATAISVWAVTSITTISWAQLVTASRAVHPAVLSEQTAYHSLIPKGQGKSSLTSLLLLSPKRHVCCGCSLVNALSTDRTCYHLFVGKSVLLPAAMPMAGGL